MAELLFLTPLFVDYILPFILVFTLIFAILQKTQLFGEGKKQIDALIGLVIGLILIAFPPARDIIVLLMPFVAVFAVILLVFMLLYGFIVGGTGTVLGKWWQIGFAALLAITLGSYLLIVTDYWTPLLHFLFGGGGQIFTTLIMIIFIVGVIVAVTLGGGTSSKS